MLRPTEERDYQLSVLQFCSYSLIITALWDMTHPVDVNGASDETAVSIIRLDIVNGGGSSFLWDDCTRVLRDVPCHNKVTLTCLRPLQWALVLTLRQLMLHIYIYIYIYI